MSTPRYDTLSIAIHWITTILFLGLCAVGIMMANGVFEPPLRYQVYNLHKSIGVTILGLTLFRIVWRFIKPAPALPNTIKPRDKFAAHTAHKLLYLALIAIPLSGWLMSNAFGFGAPFFDFFTLPALIEKNPSLGKIFSSAHTFGAFAALALIGVHALAALYHHYKERDVVLWRMLPLLKQPQK